MRILRTLSYVVAALAAFAQPLAARAPLEKPNVVLVFLDDCGYGDFAHTGNPTIHTPNVSRLVAEGLSFPQFYTASGACSASRYSILTGRNPARSGLGAWVLGPNSRKYLHPEEITVAEALKSQGYATAMFGKWHLGNPNKANDFTEDAFPLAHGFDEWLGTNVSNDYNPGANLIESANEGSAPIPGYRMLEENFALNASIQGGLTGRYTDRAVAFIEKHRERPFFLYLPFNMPHLPVVSSPGFEGRSKRGLYGDVIEEIDHAVGRIRAALEASEIAENTLLVFTSDNGPWIRFQDTATHNRYGEARLNIGSALPFRDGKGSTWEGGVRVPGVFWWPGVIDPFTVVREPASTMDIFPSVLALAGASVPTDRELDGRDIRPYFSSKRFEGSVAPFEFIYTGAGDNKIYGSRYGPWKAHIRLYSQTGDSYGFEATRESPLLFQVEHDVGERINRASQHPNITTDLVGRIAVFERSLQIDKPFWDR